MNNVTDALKHYPLLDALIERRSRHFATGMKMNGGPLACECTRSPQLLMLEEQAALVELPLD